MITARQETKLRKLIRELVEAEIENSWKGGGDPAAIPEIEANLRSAGLALDNFLLKLRQE